MRTRTTRRNTNTGWNRTTTRRTGNPYSATFYNTNSPKYNPIRQEFTWRVGSYQNVFNQINSGRKTAFSPTNANKWMRYVNRGGQVYQFTQTEFTRYFGARWANNTPTATRKFLTTRYGTAIADVARGNNNTWLIATRRTPTARPFANYNWHNWK